MTPVQLYVILRLGVFPGAAAVVAVLLARLATRDETRRAWLLALGAAAGSVIAYVGLAGVPPFPPIDSMGYVPIMTVAALVAFVAVQRAPGTTRLAGLIVALIIGAATAYLVGKPTWTRTGIGAALPYLGLAALAIVVVTEGLAHAAEKLHPAAVGFALIAAITGASVASLLSHSALLAMILGGVATTTGALTVTGWVLKVPLRGRAVMGALVVPLGGVILYARLFSALPVIAALLLIGAALAPLLIAVLPRFRFRSLLAPILALVLAGGAVYVANAAGAARESELY